MKIFIIFLTMIILLTGCAADNNEDNISSADDMFVSKTANEIKREEIVENGRDISVRSIKNAYPQQELLGCINFGGYINLDTGLLDLNSKFPVECFREFDDSLDYCIYKLKEGGYAIIFFRPGGLGLAECVFIIKEPLEQSDFYGIKQGDSISDVWEVDKGSQFVYEYAKSAFTLSFGIDSNGVTRSPTTYHIVKDGFIKIKYITDKTLPAGTTDDDLKKNYVPTYKVDKIEFIKNGDFLTDNSYHYFFPDLADELEPKYKVNFLQKDYNDIIKNLK